jgi:hypothetical protein
MASYSCTFVNNDPRVVGRVGILSDVRVGHGILVGVEKGGALVFDILGQHSVSIEGEDYFA